MVKRAWDNLQGNKIMTIRQIESIADAQSHRTFFMLEIITGRSRAVEKWSEMGPLKLEKLVLQWKSTFHFSLFLSKMQKRGTKQFGTIFQDYRRFPKSLLCIYHKFTLTLITACLPVQLQGHLCVPYLPVKLLYAHQQSGIQTYSTITNKLYIKIIRLSDLHFSVQWL